MEVPPVIGTIHAHIDGSPEAEMDRSISITPLGSVLIHSPKMPRKRPACVIEGIGFQNDLPSEYLNRYSKLVREGHKAEVIKAIGVVSENVKNIEILTNDINEAYLSVAIGEGGLRPLHDLGGGAVRLTRLLLGFYAARDGMLLSDELENGIHYAARRAVWDKAKQWMERWNVQFIATTQSGELIDAAIDAFEENPADLSIHQIYRDENEGRIKAVTFTGEALMGVRDMSLEIR